jgi:hypothetical protein
MVRIGMIAVGLRGQLHLPELRKKKGELKKNYANACMDLIKRLRSKTLIF